MSDYNSSLPVRTENPGDIVAKIGDGTTPSQQLAIDAAGLIGAKLSDGAGVAITSQVNGTQQALDVGINVAGVQIDPRDIRALTASDVVTANQGAPALIANAWYVRPTDGTNSQSYTVAGEAKVSVTQPLPAGTNSIGTVKAQLQDNAGAAITLGQKPMATSVPVVIASDQSPIPVSISQDNPGDEINNYDVADSVAGNATDNHDYTVTTGKTLLLTQIEAAGSGKMKIEVQIEDGVASDSFDTVFVKFNSTSDPNMSIQLKAPISVPADVRVRIIRTNRDNQPQNVYSTICGNEI